MTMDDLAALLQGHRFRFCSEAELQSGIQSILDAADVTYFREYRLDTSSRIDFLVETIDEWDNARHVGIEVKVDGARFEVVRQLSRYADYDKIHALVLVTSRRRLADMPSSINGKDVKVVVTGGGF